VRLQVHGCYPRLHGYRTGYTFTLRSLVGYVTFYGWVWFTVGLRLRWFWFTHVHIHGYRTTFTLVGCYGCGSGYRIYVAFTFTVTVLHWLRLLRLVGWFGYVPGLVGYGLVHTFTVATHVYTVYTVILRSCYAVYVPIPHVHTTTPHTFTVGSVDLRSHTFVTGRFTTFVLRLLHYTRLRFGLRYGCWLRLDHTHALGCYTPPPRTHGYGFTHAFYTHAHTFTHGYAHATRHFIWFCLRFTRVHVYGWFARLRYWILRLVTFAILVYVCGWFTLRLRFAILRVLILPIYVYTRFGCYTRLVLFTFRLRYTLHVYGYVYGYGCWLTLRVGWILRTVVTRLLLVTFTFPSILRLRFVTHTHTRLRFAVLPVTLVYGLVTVVAFTTVYGCLTHVGLFGYITGYVYVYTQFRLRFVYIYLRLVGYVYGCHVSVYIYILRLRLPILHTRLVGYTRFGCYRLVGLRLPVGYVYTRFGLHFTVYAVTTFCHIYTHAYRLGWLHFGWLLHTHGLRVYGYHTQDYTFTFGYLRYAVGYTVVVTFTRLVVGLLRLLRLRLHTTHTFTLRFGWLHIYVTFTVCVRLRLHTYTHHTFYHGWRYVYLRLVGYGYVYTRCLLVYAHTFVYGWLRLRLVTPLRWFTFTIYGYTHTLLRFADLHLVGLHGLRLLGPRLDLRLGCTFTLRTRLRWFGRLRYGLRLRYVYVYTFTRLLRLRLHLHTVTFGYTHVTFTVGYAVICGYTTVVTHVCGCLRLVWFTHVYGYTLRFARLHGYTFGLRSPRVYGCYGYTRLLVYAHVYVWIPVTVTFTFTVGWLFTGLHLRSHTRYGRCGLRLPHTHGFGYTHRLRLFTRFRLLLHTHTVGVTVYTTFTHPLHTVYTLHAVTHGLVRITGFTVYVYTHGYWFGCTHTLRCGYYVLVVYTRTRYARSRFTPFGLRWVTLVAVAVVAFTHLFVYRLVTFYTRYTRWFRLRLRFPVYVTVTGLFTHTRLPFVVTLRWLVYGYHTHVPVYVCYVCLRLRLRLRYAFTHGFYVTLDFTFDLGYTFILYTFAFPPVAFTFVTHTTFTRLRLDTFWLVTTRLRLLLVTVAVTFTLHFGYGYVPGYVYVYVRLIYVWLHADRLHTFTFTLYGCRLRLRWFCVPVTLRSGLRYTRLRLHTFTFTWTTDFTLLRCWLHLHLRWIYRTFPTFTFWIWTPRLRLRCYVTLLHLRCGYVYVVTVTVTVTVTRLRYGLRVAVCYAVTHRFTRYTLVYVYGYVPAVLPVGRLHTFTHTFGYTRLHTHAILPVTFGLHLDYRFTHHGWTFCYICRGWLRLRTVVTTVGSHAHIRLHLGPVLRLHTFTVTPVTFVYAVTFTFVHILPVPTFTFTCCCVCYVTFCSTFTLFVYVTVYVTFTHTFPFTVTFVTRYVTVVGCVVVTVTFTFVYVYRLICWLRCWFPVCYVAIRCYDSRLVTLVTFVG